jgi:hypothetical protein
MVMGSNPHVTSKMPFPEICRENHSGQSTLVFFVNRTIVTLVVVEQAFETLRWLAMAHSETILETFILPETTKRHKTSASLLLLVTGRLLQVQEATQETTSDTVISKPPIYHIFEMLEMPRTFETCLPLKTMSPLAVEEGLANHTICQADRLARLGMFTMIGISPEIGEAMCINRIVLLLDSIIVITFVTAQITETPSLISETHSLITETHRLRVSVISESTAVLANRIQYHCFKIIVTFPGTEILLQCETPMHL